MPPILQGNTFLLPGLLFSSLELTCKLYNLKDITMRIEKYSIGIGDRFGHQGVAQLSALVKAKAEGANVVPVWNKSNREHSLIGSLPADARNEANNAVAQLEWKDSFYLDADHIGLKTVDKFIEHCDFYTIDVADFIGQPVAQEKIDAFVAAASKFIGTLAIPGVSKSFEVTKEVIDTIAKKYLGAIVEASKIYQHVASAKGADNFVTEVSLDENEEPQSPEDMFFILMGLSLENVPVQTLAPKFTGRFNKGVDYVGDLSKFVVEFEDDVAVIAYAVKLFTNLPDNLKLSVHSGSDKFSLYKPIHDIITKHNAGLHLKTAGTTWLEEVIGLAEAGGEGLDIAKEIYAKCFSRIDELIAPYATVVDIDMKALPTPEEVNTWSSEKFVNTLRHEQSCSELNLSFRQLVHVSFKIAAEMGKKYTNALEKFSEITAKNVSENLYKRHICPLFLGK